MMNLLRALLEMPKFTTLVVGLAVSLTTAIALSFGFDVDTTLVAQITSSILVLVTLIITAQALTSSRKRRSSTNDTERGTIDLLLQALMVFAVAFFLTMCFFLLSCAAARGAASGLAHDVVDCTTDKAKDAIHQLGPTLEDVIFNAADNLGRVNADRVKHATMNFAADVGGCAVFATMKRLRERPVPDPSAPQAEGLRLDAEGLDAAEERLRIEQYGGKRFRL
jgi:hypothetical protein